MSRRVHSSQQCVGGAGWEWPAVCGRGGWEWPAVCGWGAVGVASSVLEVGGVFVFDTASQ